MPEMPSPEEIEAAAIALCWSGFIDPKSTGFRSAKSYWRKVAPFQKAAYRKEIRDAIDAIRRAGLNISDPAAIRSAETAAYQRGQADEREDCARVADAADRHWHARITAQGRIGDSDVYASGAANAASEIAAAIRARSTPSDTGDRDNG